jgi:hypothetical protein
MTDSIEVSGLAGVKFLPGTDQNSVCLMLSDTKGKEAGFLINAEGLGALLLPALGLATRWADATDLQVETWSGPKNALPAQHIELDKGRTNTECALRVFVGKIELTFLVPLDTMIHAASWLVQQVDPSSGHQAH